MPLRLDDLEDLLTSPRREDFSTDNFGSDTTTVLDLDDLGPDTRYGYILYVRQDQCVVLGPNRIRGFRTPLTRRIVNLSPLLLPMPFTA